MPKYFSEQGQQEAIELYEELENTSSTQQWVIQHSQNQVVNPNINKSLNTYLKSMQIPLLSIYISFLKFIPAAEIATSISQDLSFRQRLFSMHRKVSLRKELPKEWMFTFFVILFTFIFVSGVKVIVSEVQFQIYVYFSSPNTGICHHLENLIAKNMHPYYSSQMVSQVLKCSHSPFPVFVIENSILLFIYTHTVLLVKRVLCFPNLLNKFIVVVGLAILIKTDEKALGELPKCWRADRSDRKSAYVENMLPQNQEDCN